MTTQRKKKQPNFADTWGSLATRIAVGMFALAVVVQYVRIIDRNIVVAREVREQEAAIRDLQSKTGEQQRHIARLLRPDGAIPEIHDRLHLVGLHEAIVYLHHDGDGRATSFAQTTP